MAIPSQRCVGVCPERNGMMEALLAVALQGALIATLVFGTEKLPKGAWNDGALSTTQSKTIQGFLALCVVFHHCAQKVFFDSWGSGFRFTGLEVMALMGFAFVGYFFFCSGYGLYQSCQNKRNYLDGFLRRRALPLLLIYFACNTVYLVGRLAMGQTFAARRLISLLCGFELANPNSWFVVTLPLMYLLFYVSKRGCSDEAVVTRRLFLGVGIYILAGMAFSNGGGYVLFRGRWWYNTAILFPLGYLFGRREQEIVAWMKGSYRKQVACSIAFFAGSFLLSLVLMLTSSPILVTLALESFSAVCFTWALLLFSLRRRVASPLLSFFGGLTLELYLMHGFFVNLFYQPFYDMGSGIFTIGSPVAYILLVLACGTAVALLFKQVTKRLLG